HSDYTDIEGKVGAYLLENDEYVLEVHSDNRPDEVIGSYSADIGEEKIISLYDVELASEATGFDQNVRYTINLQNVSNATSIVFAYFDGEELTDSIQFKVWENRYNDTLLYTSPVYTNTSQFGHLVWDIVGYENSTLVGELIIQHQVEGEVHIARTVKKEWTLALPLMDYVSQEFMNWFFTIFLSIVVIMASANLSMTALAIIGLAVLFVLFGWYGLSFTALGFALLVALIEIWAKRGK
ncbi:MAG: hypothetical protein PHC75_10575, partial [Burkholderiales bacterium]|nr:hypothetical protein [Burkholderiales bacterium]